MLTLTDLHQTLADDRHLGWGYACCQDLGATTLARLDKAIIAVANEMSLDYEDLFHWSNSKHGRWLFDSVYGNSNPPTRATVRILLNPQTIELSKEDW